jgi:hypothetical protein
VWIAESNWAFPALEVVHIFAVSMVFGTIAIIDLRLLELKSTKRLFPARAYPGLAHKLLITAHSPRLGSNPPSERLAPRASGSRSTSNTDCDHTNCGETARGTCGRVFPHRQNREKPPVLKGKPIIFPL